MNIVQNIKQISYICIKNVYNSQKIKCDTSTKLKSYLQQMIYTHMKSCKNNDNNLDKIYRNLHCF